VPVLRRQGGVQGRCRSGCPAPSRPAALSARSGHQRPASAFVGARGWVRQD